MIPHARRYLLTLLAPLAIAASGALFAHEAGEQETHQLLMQQALSDAHFHPGSVFAYVLDGAVQSQLQGQPVHTYRKGNSWYETPGAHRLVSRNASTTAPATLLVFALGGAGDPIKLPLPDTAARVAALPRSASH